MNLPSNRIPEFDELGLAIGALIRDRQLTLIKGVIRLSAPENRTPIKGVCPSDVDPELYLIPEALSDISLREPWRPGEDVPEGPKGLIRIAFRYLPMRGKPDFGPNTEDPKGSSIDGSYFDIGGGFYRIDNVEIEYKKNGGAESIVAQILDDTIDDNTTIPCIVSPNIENTSAWLRHLINVDFLQVPRIVSID